MSDLEALKKWRYAPGSYECRCFDCGKSFDGDKRASCCLVCAEGHEKYHQETLARIAAKPAPMSDDKALAHWLDCPKCGARSYVKRWALNASSGRHEAWSFCATCKWNGFRSPDQAALPKPQSGLYAIGLDYGYEGKAAPLTLVADKLLAENICDLLSKAHSQRTYCVEVPIWPATREEQAVALPDATGTKEGGR